MKFLHTSLLLCCVLLLAACGGKKPKAGFITIKPDDFFELKVGASAVMTDTKFKLTFTGVPEDSRCPKYTQCIQEGQVRATFTVALDGKGQPPIELVRKPSDKGPTTATVGGFKILLYDMTPVPESGKKINPADYVARMALKRVAPETMAPKE